ncbi:hypothetical protein Tco_0534535 [Tanacetum coccineum]
MFMHTARDDSILGPMRFVSNSDDFQVYGALLPNKMTNQQMLDSNAYKTYLAYATEEEEFEPAKKDKPIKKPVAKRYYGIELLSDAAILKEAQLKKDLKRSKRETNIHQVGGSRVPDVSKGDSSKSKYKSWGDSGNEANVQDDEEVQESDDEPQHADDERTNFENQETNDDEEETKDEFVHTPPNYVPTNDETNDESNDVTEEEYERINEELYSDINIRLTYAEPTNEEKGDEEIIDTGHVNADRVNVIQEGACNQVKDDAQATQKTEVPLHIQHEVPRTSSLLTIPVSVIPKHNVINPPETVTTALATIIYSLLTSLFPHLQQSKPITTPTTTEATTSTTTVPDSETLATLQLRVTDLEKDVKELKDVDNSTRVISKIKSEVPNTVKEYLGSSLDDALHKVIQKNNADIIKEHFVQAKTIERLRQQYVPQKSVEDIREIKMEHARKQQVPKETITSSDTTALEEFDEKTTLFETMSKSKCFDKLKKRKLDYVDKDEGPSDGSDRGLKRRKTSRDTEPSKKAKSTETSKGTSKSQPKSTGKSAQAEETMFEAGDTQGLQHLREDMGNTDEPPVVNVDPKDWFKKLERPPTPDPEWHKGKSVENKPTQRWLSDLAKAEKPSRTFDDLMSTPIDISAFVMNLLQISELTQDILVGPAYNILKGTCRSYVKLDYNTEECYKALTNQLDWNNPEVDRYPFNLSKPLPLVMLGNCQIVPVDYFFNNDLEYLQRGSTDRTYTTSLTKTNAAKYDLPGIKDMVPNLWSPVKVAYDNHALLGTSHWGPKRQSFYGYASNRVSKHDVYSTKRILAVTNVKVKEWYGYGHLEEINVQRSDQKLYKFMEGDFP